MNRHHIAMLKHDVLLSRKTLIGTAVSYIVCIILTMLVFLSAKYGNIAKYSEGNAYIILSLRFSMLMFTTLCCSVPFTEFSGKNVISDMNCGWQKYIYTTPLTVKEQLTYRYGINIMGLVTSVILVLPELTVLRLCSGQWSGKTELILIAYIIAYCYILTVVSLPLNAYFRSTDKAGLISMVITMVLLVPVMIIFMDKIDETDKLAKAGGQEVDLNMLTDQLEGYIPYLAAAVPVLIIVSTVLSYHFMKKILEKKVC
ncbi:ABC-2 transporter permease [Ruminococcus sp.]|uniref:ABC-2 transporter permease n=1 Tax=Ruminococcus sp. TaxID=41978 RepID=UPI0025F57F97|nr:ABC-2 transporter permease [Ruminococcus sp.]MBQ8966489.1 ABC-2 transporter permease [Ruminococcus sp.]